MHTETSAPRQGLIRQSSLCHWLDLSRSGLDRLKAKDPTFPKPLKAGSARQAAAYYVVAEVDAWLQSKITERDTTAAEGGQA